MSVRARRKVAAMFLDASSMGILDFLSSQMHKCPVVLARVRLCLHNNCQDAAAGFSSILVYQQFTVLREVKKKPKE